MAETKQLSFDLPLYKQVVKDVIDDKIPINSPSSVKDSIHNAVDSLGGKGDIQYYILDRDYLKKKSVNLGDLKTFKEINTNIIKIYNIKRKEKEYLSKKAITAAAGVVDKILPKQTAEDVNYRTEHGHPIYDRPFLFIGKMVGNRLNDGISITNSIIGLGLLAVIATMRMPIRYAHERRLNSELVREGRLPDTSTTSLHDGVKSVLNTVSKTMGSDIPDNIKKEIHSKVMSEEVTIRGIQTRKYDSVIQVLTNTSGQILFNTIRGSQRLMQAIGADRAVSWANTLVGGIIRELVITLGPLMPVGLLLKGFSTNKILLSIVGTMLLELGLDIGSFDICEGTKDECSSDVVTGITEKDRVTSINLIHKLRKEQEECRIQENCPPFDDLVEQIEKSFPSPEGYEQQVTEIRRRDLSSYQLVRNTNLNDDLRIMMQTLVLQSIASAGIIVATISISIIGDHYNKSRNRALSQKVKTFHEMAVAQMTRFLMLCLLVVVVMFYVFSVNQEKSEFEPLEILAMVISLFATLLSGFFDTRAARTDIKLIKRGKKRRYRTKYTKKPNRSTKPKKSQTSHRVKTDIQRISFI